MTFTILEPNQDCRPNLFTWYFPVFLVKSPFLNGAQSSDLNQGIWKKNGEIKVTGMN